MENSIEKSHCDICGLTSDYQYIGLNDEGRCKYCEGFNFKTFKGLDRLVNDLDLADGEQIGVTVSGGKDSIYMWGVLTQLLGKDRVVAFTYYRQGLTHRMAMDNILRAKAVIGTELVIIEDKSAFEKFKKNLISLLKKPEPAMVRVLLCVGCRYGITENLYREGEGRGVKKYISGASYLELAPFKEEILEDKSKARNMDDALNECLKLYPELDYDDNFDLIRRDQKFKYKNNETLSNNISSATYRYQLYDFDDYTENNPFEIEKIVREKYDWECPDRSWHFDCIVEEFKDVFYYGLLGYTEMDFKLAAMVRYKLLSKAEAEERLNKFNQEIKRSFNKMRDKLLEYGLEGSVDDLKAFYQSSRYLEYRTGE